jgi:hypothetical protein
MHAPAQVLCSEFAPGQGAVGQFVSNPNSTAESKTFENQKANAVCRMGLWSMLVLVVNMAVSPGVVLASVCLVAAGCVLIPKRVAGLPLCAGAISDDRPYRVRRSGHEVGRVHFLTAPLNCADQQSCFQVARCSASLSLLRTP